MLMVWFGGVVWLCVLGIGLVVIVVNGQERMYVGKRGPRRGKGALSSAPLRGDAVTSYKVYFTAKSLLSFCN